MSYCNLGQNLVVQRLQLPASRVRSPVSRSLATLPSSTGAAAPRPRLRLGARRRCGGDSARPGGSARHRVPLASPISREAVLATEVESRIFLNQPRPHVQMSGMSVIVKLILGLLWGIIHLAINIFNLWSHLIYNLECYLISCGLLWMYRNLDLGRLKYLAIVVDSKEAKDTAKIKQLLFWLSTIGLKYVCLYDIEGVLKKTFDPAMNVSRDGNWRKYLDIGANIKDIRFGHREMVLECISGSDGKEGIAKAANLLCSTYLNGDTQENGKRKPVFTEADMANALKAAGCGGPEPDLLLMYGPARCHLGFPAWRLRYTEIMHLGPLKSMKYGALVKALYTFSKKHQNYGK